MMGMEWVTSPEAWVALLTLTALEIVLGIDNIIFISILVGRLPEHQRQRARIQGLAFAMLSRIALLLSLAWVMRLTSPLFTVLEQEISGRDLILILGDNVKRTWKQIIYFNSGAHGEEVKSKKPVRLELPETEAFTFAGDIELISDERGVRIAREEAD